MTIKEYIFDNDEILIDPKDLEFILTQSQVSEGEQMNKELSNHMQFKKNFIFKVKEPCHNRLKLIHFKESKFINFNPFNTDVMIIAISPQDEREFVKVYCNNCNQLYI